MSVDVTVIIVNYNTENLLENCIDSVLRKTVDINYEIIVVDNNSTIKSLDHLVNKYRDVKFVLLDTNIGFGGANNKGAELAKGKYLFFLNPDTLLINNSIRILNDFLENNLKVGICGANLYSKEMKSISSFYDKDPLIIEFMLLLNLKRTVGFNITESPQRVKFIVGADLFIRKNLFLDAGGFDLDFFMYYEEIELCNRVSDLGWHIYSVPEAKIIHLQGQSAENKTGDLSKWSYQEHWYSKWIYFMKTKGIFITNCIYRLHRFKINIALFVFRSNRKKDKIEYWKMRSKVLENSFSRYHSFLNKQCSKLDNNEQVN